MALEVVALDNMSSSHEGLYTMGEAQFQGTKTGGDTDRRGTKRLYKPTEQDIIGPTVTKKQGAASQQVSSLSSDSVASKGTDQTRFNKKIKTCQQGPISRETEKVQRPWPPMEVPRLGMTSIWELREFIGRRV